MKEDLPVFELEPLCLRIQIHIVLRFELSESDCPRFAPENP